MKELDDLCRAQRGVVVLDEIDKAHRDVLLLLLQVLEHVEQPQVADLSLSLGELTPWALIGCLIRGEKPPLRIEGDVQMAAEINWLADHVRWNPEEDLARLLGDAQAQALVLLGRRLGEALRGFARAGAAGGRFR